MALREQLRTWFSKCATDADVTTYQVERMTHEGGWKPIDVPVELNADTPPDLIKYNFLEAPGRYRLVARDATGSYHNTIWSFETDDADDHYRQQRQSLPPADGATEPSAESRDTAEQANQETESDVSTTETRKLSPSERMELNLRQQAFEKFDEAPFEVKESVWAAMLNIDPDEREDN